MASSDSEQTARPRTFRTRALGWTLATVFGSVQGLVLAASIATALGGVRAAAGEAALIDLWLSPRETPFLFAGVIVAGVGFVAIGLMFELRWRWRWCGLAGLLLAALLVLGASTAFPKTDGYATAEGAGFVRRGGPVTAFHRWESASGLDIRCRIGGSRAPNRVLHVDVTFGDGNVAALSRDLTNETFPDFLSAAEAIERWIRTRPSPAPVIRRSAHEGCVARAPAALRPRLERLTGARLSD